MTSKSSHIQKGIVSQRFFMKLLFIPLLENREAKEAYNHEHSFKVLWISWIPKRHRNICLNKNLCSNIHSSIILNRMDTEQMSSKGWTDKQMWCFQTTTYYSTIKWDEVLIYNIIWMNFDYYVMRKN